jgi:hypothetical protein
VCVFSLSFFSFPITSRREGPTRPPKRPPARRCTNVGQWYKTHRAPISCVCIHVSSPGTGSPLLLLWSAHFHPSANFDDLNFFSRICHFCYSDYLVSASSALAVNQTNNFSHSFIALRTFSSSSSSSGRNFSTVIRPSRERLLSLSSRLLHRVSD